MSAIAGMGGYRSAAAKLRITYIMTQVPPTLLGLPPNPFYIEAELVLLKFVPDDEMAERIARITTISRLCGPCSRSNSINVLHPAALIPAGRRKRCLDPENLVEQVVAQRGCRAAR